jgi:hypothetical protein
VTTTMLTTATATIDSVRIIRISPLPSFRLGTTVFAVRLPWRDMGVPCMCHDRLCVLPPPTSTPTGTIDYLRAEGTTAPQASWPRSSLFPLLPRGGPTRTPPHAPDPPTARQPHAQPRTTPTDVTAAHATPPCASTALSPRTTGPPPSRPTRWDPPQPLLLGLTPWSMPPAQLSGSSGALLRRSPLRTGRAIFTASGSSKSRGR